MNKKKFFGLLTSAAMLLNATPLSVLAEEMVEASGVVGAVTNADGSIALNDQNFPDTNLLNAIKGQNEGITDAAKVTSLVLPDEDGTVVKDFSGLQYLTGLTDLSISNNPNLENLNLSTNTDLINLTLTNNDSLYSVTLPETQSLKNVTITENDALTSLDLSPATLLDTADISNNAIAQLDVSNNPFLTELDVNGNKLYKLDTTGCPKLSTLEAAANKIYELKIADKAINVLNVAGNKLREFDGSNMGSLTQLNIADNMLESIALPNTGNITNLNVDQNHLASIDLSDAVSSEATPSDIVTGTQSLFAGVDDTAIDLKTYDPDFDVDQVVEGKDSINKNGVATLPSSDSSNNGNEEKDVTPNSDNVIVKAKLLSATEAGVTVEFNAVPKDGSDLDASDLGKIDFEIQNVTGTATVDDDRVSLKFGQVQDTKNTFEATPKPEEGALIVFYTFENEEVYPEWTGGNPTEIAIKGKVKVSGAEINDETLPFTLGDPSGEEASGYLKEGEFVEAKVEDANTDQPDQEETVTLTASNTAVTFTLDATDAADLTKATLASVTYTPEDGTPVKLDATKFAMSALTKGADDTDGNPTYTCTLAWASDAIEGYTFGEDVTSLTNVPATKASEEEVTDSARLVSMEEKRETESVLEKVPSALDYTYNSQAKVNAGTVTPMEVNVYKELIMNRLYNPNSGEHFYTKDTHERDVLVSLRWQAEGVGWVAPKAGEGTTTPVYRLYNKNAGDHHYTKDANEKDTLVKIGWTFEGVGWYSAEDPEAYIPSATDEMTGTPSNRTIEVFREYNPNAKEAGAHNYTISENENATLVSIGWIDEGIAWNALK